MRKTDYQKQQALQMAISFVKDQGKEVNAAELLDIAEKFAIFTDGGEYEDEFNEIGLAQAADPNW